MPFLSGGATFRRFTIDLPATISFDERHVEALAKHAAGKIISGDGTNTGWGAGEHVLDTTFTYAKNVLEDRMLWSLRIETNKLPTELLRAYTAIDLAALSKDNPSGLPSARQKREAKESARDRLEEEANDGRFIKWKLVECLWDLRFGELFFGETGEANVPRLLALFKETFALEPIAVDAFTEAVVAATRLGIEPRLSGVSPSQFGLDRYDDVAWCLDESRPTWLGNEFLVWLWWVSDTAQDVTLSDGSRVTIMLSGGVRLECPRGTTGNDTCNSEFPVRMPELIEGLRHGKLPRKAGLTLVHRGEQCGLTLHAETLAVQGLKMPPPEEGDAHARKCARLEQVTSASQLLRVLYWVFIRLRLAPTWGHVAAKIREWVRA